jgi:hypothetical protein
MVVYYVYLDTKTICKDVYFWIIFLVCCRVSRNACDFEFEHFEYKIGIFLLWLSCMCLYIREPTSCTRRNRVQINPPCD